MCENHPLVNGLHRNRCGCLQMHCSREKTAGKIPGSVQGRFSPSLLWDKDPCDTFDWYKYVLVGKGPEGTLRDHLSL